jgi:hypothetical protein
MPDKNLTMTKADEEALKRCPDGWFEAGCRDLVYVKNADYRCTRLVERGKLETEVRGDIPHLTRFYRKVS